MLSKLDFSKYSLQNDKLIMGVNDQDIGKNIGKDIKFIISKMDTTGQSGSGSAENAGSSRDRGAAHIPAPIHPPLVPVRAPTPGLPLVVVADLISPPPSSNLLPNIIFSPSSRGPIFDHIKSRLIFFNPLVNPNGTTRLSEYLEYEINRRKHDLASLASQRFRDMSLNQSQRDRARNLRDKLNESGYITTMSNKSLGTLKIIVH